MTIKSISAVIAAVGLCAITATPALSQDGESNSALVFHGGTCDVFVFQPGGPLILTGGRDHTVFNNGAKLDVGNIIFSCRGVTTDAVPEKTEVSEVNCGTFTFDPATGTFTTYEGRGQLVLNKAGRFQQTCTINGVTEVGSFSFITAP